MVLTVRKNRTMADCVKLALARIRVELSTFLSFLHRLGLVIQIDLSSTRVPGGKRVGEDTAVFSQPWRSNSPLLDSDLS